MKHQLSEDFRYSQHFKHTILQKVCYTFIIEADHRHKSNPRTNHKPFPNNIGGVPIYPNVKKQTFIVLRAKSRPKQTQHPLFQEEVASAYGADNIVKRCKSTMRNGNIIFNTGLVFSYRMY